MIDFVDLLSASAEQGVFAVLFLFTFWFILNEYKRREESQRTLYSALAASLEKAKGAIASIEGKIERIDNTQGNISQDLLEVKYMIDNIENIVAARSSFRGPADAAGR